MGAPALPDLSSPALERSSPKFPRTIHYRADGLFMISGPTVSKYRRWFKPQNLAIGAGYYDQAQFGTIFDPGSSVRRD